MTVPRQWRLPADHSAARMARGHVREAFASAANLEDIELVVSELVANAIDHGGPPVDLGIEDVDGARRITVASATSDRTPHRLHPHHEENSGRGLGIVEDLSSDWGWQADGERLLVWADFADS